MKTKQNENKTIRNGFCNHNIARMNALHTMAGQTMEKGTEKWHGFKLWNGVGGKESYM